MSEANVICPFSGHDGATVNIRFFRGSRDGIITVEEMEAEARSAALQHKTGKATISKSAPISRNKVVNVQEIVSTL